MPRVNGSNGEFSMNVQQEVLGLLDEVLSLNGRTSAFSRNTHLLGAIPELDSMAVVSLITGLEERFDMAIDDDDIDGSTFATVGSLVDFISGKIAA
jgi:acyl carrier protein